MTSTAIRAFFASRSEAETAAHRLDAAGLGAETVFSPAREAAQTEPDWSEVPEGEADWIVTARPLSAERVEAATEVLEQAGALHIEGFATGEGAESGSGWTRFFRHLGEMRPPPEVAQSRPVQPGFADAPPGIVPEPAPDLGRPPETAEVKGRFADQLDRLPETPGQTGRDPEEATPLETNVEAVPPGTPGAGENVCRACAGSGRIGERVCPECGGSGKVTTPIGGG